MRRGDLYGWVAIAITLATIAASAALYPQLPEKIPTHWNIRGEVDGFGTKPVGVLLLPATMLGLLGLFRILPWLSPKDFKIEPFKSTYEYITTTAIGLFAYIHAVAMTATWRHVHGEKPFDMTRVLLAGMFLFFALIGNVMGKVRKNFYVGVRVPWTLASDRVWNDTHRFAAWTMVGGSVIGFLIVVSGLSMIAAIVVLAVSMLSPIVYSFVHYKRLEREGAL